MLFPEVPVALAVTVTTLPLAVAVTPTAALPALLMALVRLVTAVAAVPSIAKVVAVVVPLVPPLSVPVFGDKVILPPLTVEKATLLPPVPYVTSVTVTTLLERVAVTLAFAVVPVPKQGELEKHCPENPLIAARKFEAVLLVLPATATTSLAFEKLPVPPLNVAPDTVILPPLTVARATVFPVVPAVMAVTVTTLVETVAVTLAFAAVPVPKQPPPPLHWLEFPSIAARKF
jgi:membrane protein CcdC involved in cytochrome C biogenesis